MQVMVDEQSSTILTAGHPAVIGGTVTMETYHIGKLTNYCKHTHKLNIPILNSQLIRELCVSVCLCLDFLLFMFYVTLLPQFIGLFTL